MILVAAVSLLLDLQALTYAEVSPTDWCVLSAFVVEGEPDWSAVDKGDALCLRDATPATVEGCRRVAWTEAPSTHFERWAACSRGALPLEDWSTFSARLEILPGDIFIDGFEAGDTSAWRVP